MKPTLCIWCTVAVVVVLVGMAATASAQAAGDQAENRTAPEVFTATTTNMEPAGERLRFSVRRWSSGDDRHEVLAILTGDAGSDADNATLTRLLEVPSVGFLWPGASGIGYSLKYASRLATPDGGERITFITGRSVGALGGELWRAVDEPTPPVDGYTVIELRLDGDGHGEGKMSLAAEVVFDAAGGLVALDHYETAPVLLEAVTREPPPYWARDE